MSAVPRIAIGTVQHQADSTAITWALMDALVQSGTRVQSFLSHAYFCPRDGATAITGSPPRHLDSWLMDQAQCREALVRGCRTSDLAVVEGTFVADPCTPGGADLETLCRWLELPRVAVIDARLLGKCRMPQCPSGVDAVLLDQVADAAELCRLQTHCEAVWKVPVVGSLGIEEPLRREIQQVDGGHQPPLELCHALGDAFLRRQPALESIMALASSRPASYDMTWHGVPQQTAAGLRVAVAYDEVFRGYFPDTLEMLELRGATVVDFSPLHDEQLPAGVDVVYLGCGHPERFAEALSQNDCLMLSLKSHVSSGRRIYAECGGLAYLCQDIELADGTRWPMVGVLPYTARFDPTPGVPTPAEVHLSGDTWLGQAGATWRGYLNPHWSIAPSGHPECSAGGDPGHELDVVRRYQAIGSRVYLNFATHAELLDSFFSPRAAAAPAATSSQPAR